MLFYIFYVFVMDISLRYTLIWQLSDFNNKFRRYTKAHK